MQVYLPALFDLLCAGVSPRVTSSLRDICLTPNPSKVTIATVSTHTACPLLILATGTATKTQPHKMSNYM